MEKLSDSRTELLLKKWKIRTPPQFLAKREDELKRYAKTVGYPVALKISSTDIVHKSEVGGLILNIRSADELLSSFKSLMRRVTKKKPKARIDGVIVQKMLDGTEVIIGGKQDSTFGPAIMFGLGGIFVEILKDVSFRLAPLTRKDVKEMISETKGYKILLGARGKPGVDMRSLENCILNVSKMLWAHSPEGGKKKPLIKELDINPLFASETGVVATDVRIMI